MNKNLSKKKLFFFALIFISAVFLRFWNVPNTVQFLGDQGRDSLIVAKIFKERDLVFIGPVTSVGNMYLGPLYYYFMVPFLMLSYPSPLGPIYAVALLGVITIYLMYSLGKEIVGEKAAIIAATLMTFSATVVAGTRFSWNPNPAPLVSLVLLFYLNKSLRENSKYWIVVFICFSVLIQLHYLTLLAGIGIGIFWLWDFYQRFKTKNLLKNFIIHSVISGLVFLVFLIPLVLFDIKHEGLNYKAFEKIIFNEESFDKKSDNFLGTLNEYFVGVKGRGRHILFDISIGSQEDTNTVLLVLASLIFIYLLKNTKKHDDIYYGKLIIAVFLFTGIISTTFYKHSIFDHYIAYLFPVTFLTFGILGEYLYKKGLIGKSIVVFFIILFTNYNFVKLKEVLTSTGWTLNDIQSTAKTIADRVEVGEKFNVVLLNGTGDLYGQNYEYFLYTFGKPKISIYEIGNAETLFIIDEERKYGNYQNSPVYEISTFPAKVPSEVYQINDGPEITVLRRNN
ncbi:glycosyltransferase family 39 protein [Candidatus Woesebacteria bacterium]|nr:glycosyltransferase family 39 protein [Candidatus Woesebacteria bacterium]